MNNVLFLQPTARTSFDPGAGLYSDHMLAELIALHEEMIVQLRAESQGANGHADHLTEMINQHEKTVAMLRARLENDQADNT
jgi:DNA-binding ferritin-like protein